MFPIILWAVVFVLFFIVIWIVSAQLNSSDITIEEGPDQEKEKKSSP